MSRRAVCNQCGAEVALNEYGLTPAGWLSISVTGPPYVQPIDLCGAKCAILALTPKGGTDGT